MSDAWSSTGSSNDLGPLAPSAPASSGITGAGPSGIPGISGGAATAGTAASVDGGLNTAVSVTKDANSLGKMMGADNNLTTMAGSKMGLSSSTMGQIGGAVGGGLGVFGAFESNGGFGGALQGAMGGAELGNAVGGPIGAAIGAVAGGIVGLFGFGGASKAAHYDQYTVKPRVSADLLSFESGDAEYASVYDDLNKLELEAKQQTKQWGSGGTRYYNDTIKSEIATAEQRLEREYKAGRQNYGMSGAQFHGGGQVLGFGDLATGPNEGYINAQVGETVMHRSATSMHGDALGLMLAGANRQQMSNYYGAQQMAPSYRATMQNGAFNGGGSTISNSHQWNVNALDSKSVIDLLMNNKHGVRAAMNASYAENSGGSDFYA